MADLSKVKIGEVTYNLKDETARDGLTAANSAIAVESEARISADAALSSAIAAEASARAATDSSLAERIDNLESRGRFLSSWNASTGVPGDYPDVPSSAESPYTYTYKVGDYYLIDTIAASGSTNYKPTGASITATKSGDEWVWTVGKTEVGSSENAPAVGDYYVCSKITDGVATWILVQNSQKSVSFANIGGAARDNSNLAAELTALESSIALKADKATTIAGISLGADISKEAMQTALGLEDLAYAETATGTFTPAGTITIASYTPAGEVTLSDFSTTSASATLSKSDYTPAGSITGTAISGGSISVTIKDATTATDAAVTSTEYTPAGNIVAGQTAAALTSASLQADSDGVQITGSVNTPGVNLTSAETTVVASLTGGSVASFDVSKFNGGSFTGATQASFTQGSKASFTQGSKASLTAQSTAEFAIEGVKVAVGTASGETETLIFTVASKATAVTDRGTFTANGDDEFTANGDDSFTANSVGTFSAATMASDIFVANTLQSAETAKVNNVTAAALATDLVFTGGKYRVATIKDTVLKTATFSATNKVNVIDSVKYLKQEIDEASFSGTNATLGFSGTKVENALVTGVTYDKTSTGSATFSGTAATLTATFSGTAGTVSVAPATT